MHVKSVEVNNFRLLSSATISLHGDRTIIVGRNNTGKTSFTELFYRLFSSKSPKFELEDFSASTYNHFLEAYSLLLSDIEDDKIRQSLPTIDTVITFSYSKDNYNLGPLSEFIIDLDENSFDAIARIQYRLQDGKIKDFFADCPPNSNQESRKEFFKKIKERIPKYYGLFIEAIDPTDNKNKKTVDISDIRKALLTGFVSAQRGLDDDTSKEKNLLSNVLVKLLASAKEDTATPEDQLIMQSIEEAVDKLQSTVDVDFNDKINELLPQLETFGYPGLNDPHIRTETTVNLDNLMKNNTKIRYSGGQGVSLPESYNGLGSRNLIYILLQVYQFFKEFQSKKTFPVAHLVFIEEPEAHLHPQMQEVFIRQLRRVASMFEAKLGEGVKWPVQFIVTSHSTHIANEAPFEQIRYFINKFDTKSKCNYTHVKDLEIGLNGNGYKADRDFLYKYLTLTRCDLFFCDKAILIEGQSEHIMMPAIIKKIDSISGEKSLSSQYISTIEIGGAYAHHFYTLLDFLELRTLIITDLDSIKIGKSKKGKTTYTACPVCEATHSSNAGIKNWILESTKLPEGYVAIDTVLNLGEPDKIHGYRRIAFQTPENNSDSEYDTARSFEDAFILSNYKLFKITNRGKKSKAEKAYEIAQKEVKASKLDFAIKYALEIDDWNVPSYIKDGLIWLAKEDETEENECDKILKEIENV